MAFTDYVVFIPAILFLIALGLYVKGVIEDRIDRERLQSENRDSSLSRKCQTLASEIEALRFHLEEQLVVIKTKVSTAHSLAHQASTSKGGPIQEHVVQFKPMRFKARTKNNNKIKIEREGNA